MANFTIRVELHGAIPQHYDLLHALLEEKGLKRFIEGIDSSGNKGKWALPSGEYDFQSDQTVKEIRDMVKSVADSVKLGAWVIVTKENGRSWTTNKLSSS